MSDQLRLVQIQSMTLASSALQIRRHGYSVDLNIVMGVKIVDSVGDSLLLLLHMVNTLSLKMQ
ncbi:hypothetical protein MTR_4g016340 [Medicago truncatula]|uniref:Uncharacterized protein n=1 Tax=Medicago truncatula TaxID=3880 RepID=G7JP22_MEDTR|nr:hypothetical protein MTR_4g016340 [Medicago truncatula]